MKQAPPTRFEDIIALVALYRPGPMELIPTYTARKTGRERFDYPDARLEPILGPTYGVMVYQEQVMQIAQVIGGYTLGKADFLRRAMGKKDKEEMAKHRDIFIAGAERTVSAGRRRPRSSTSWKSSPGMASTSRIPPRTRSSPTRPPISRHTTPLRSWRRTSRW